MLDAGSIAQLRSVLENLREPIALVSTLDDSEKGRQMGELLDEVAAVSPLVTHRRDGVDDRRPSFRIVRVPSEATPTPVGVTFAGSPLGHEFPSFILAMLHVGGHPPRISDETASQIRGLEGELHFETYLSLTCQNCPDVVQALNIMSVLNPAVVSHVAIEGGTHQGEVDARGVQAVPTVFLNGEPFGSGRMSLDDILAKVDSGHTARKAARLDGLDPFEVLVVGGGPAGAAAAIYTARKGIRTGLVAERFGGQLLETMAIENYPSVTRTEGPRMAADLQQHVNEYEVEMITDVVAAELLPAVEPGGHHRVRLSNGAVLSARTVIVATGARWRTMGVPGEEAYRNKGVTFCPHCDGPLFKGKRVAVVGGGNSGVEAAIDLAGLAAEVTVVEFLDELKADRVLQDRLRSLPNVHVTTGRRTVEVTGNGTAVTGLAHAPRDGGQVTTTELDGVFVQIGLLPNTEWLDGVVDRNAHGEIVIDARGATTVPGVFAAGDCTTVSYKQIATASGAGATAALSAFDHLIRAEVDEGDLVAG